MSSEPSRAGRSQRRRPSRGAARVALALVLTAPPTAGAQVQGRFFPDVAGFELPSASPRATGFVGRVFRTTTADNLFGPTVEAEVGLGEDFPFVALRRGEQPISFGFGTEVYGRFDLTDAKSSMISNDWVVGINVTAELRRWDLTVRYFHESSHLGDEYAETFDVRRLDWSRETLEAWATWKAGGWRLAGNVGYVITDQLGLERWSAAAAADFVGKDFRLLGATARPVGGVFVDANQWTDWHLSGTARIGITFPGQKNGRSWGLGLVGHTGMSTQRQFYPAHSTYVGGELRFDL